MLIANEAIEDYRKIKQEGIIFKLHFEKAYDYVNWSFLDKVLGKNGFGSEWRSWIWNYLRSVNFFVLLNGRPRGKIQATRV